MYHQYKSLLISVKRNNSVEGTGCIRSVLSYFTYVKINVLCICIFSATCLSAIKFVLAFGVRLLVCESKKRSIAK